MNRKFEVTIEFEEKVPNERIITLMDQVILNLAWELLDEFLTSTPTYKEVC